MLKNESYAIKLYTALTLGEIRAQNSVLPLFELFQSLEQVYELQIKNFKLHLDLNEQNIQNDNSTNIGKLLRIIISALRRFGNPQVVESLKKLLQNKDSLFKTEIERAIREIETKCLSLLYVTYIPVL